MFKALALGCLFAAATAVPVLADPFPGFGFSAGSQRFPVICMTDSQIRSYFHGLGYGDVKLNVPNEQVIQVRVVDRGHVVLFSFNFCTRRILGTQVL